ncbi:uncharacterized protein LOC143043652 [Mytilus galloprovincialis]|uniref:uncharacterized protein LOC143043652 n=1 Tax=Mytilus galloprovincialis TaxID=29158 RepID=UPI003F7B544E
MATAATGEQEFDIFTCPICLEKLKSPKSLPCSHSFCEVCIGEFILSTERRTGHKLSSYPCPVCRSDVTPTNPEDEISQWTSALPQNVTISARMDHSESSKQECHLCKTESIQNKATHWCRDCSEAFCDDCLRIHNRMKISVNHKVVKIEEIRVCDSGGEPEFSLISDKCSVHTSKILVAFCFDHQELCCLLCVTAQHRKCDNVQAFEEMTNLNTDGIEFFESILKKLKAKAEELIEEKKSKYEQLSGSFKDIELAAKTSATSIKDRVDILLSSFLKELNIARDEQRIVFDDKLKAGGNLLGYVISLMKTTKSVREYGTLNLILIHLKRSENELKSRIEETRSTLNVKSVDGAGFAINNKLHQVEKADGFGIIEFALNMPIYLNEFMNQLGSCLTKIKLKLRHKKTMSFEFNVCAICMMDKIILLGGGAEFGKLSAVNCDTGTCIAKITSQKGIKRLAYDTETLSIFASCYDVHIHMCRLHELEFKSFKEIKIGGQYNGGLCIFDGFVYIIVNEELKKMKIDNQVSGLQKCFDIKTKSYSTSKGLATDGKNKRLLYTSAKGEVVATRTDGSEIFCYKDEHMNFIVSVAVNNQGCIVACDQSGKLHVISEDGKQRKTLLDKFDKIKEPRDLCFDKSGKVLFVCGDKSVEEYEVLY